MSRVPNRLERAERADSNINSFNSFQAIDNEPTDSGMAVIWRELVPTIYHKVVRRVNKGNKVAYRRIKTSFAIKLQEFK